VLWILSPIVGDIKGAATFEQLCTQYLFQKRFHLGRLVQRLKGALKQGFQLQEARATYTGY
jgi:hypothetical protein